MHLICVFFAQSRKGGATERGAFPFMQFAETGLEERFDRFMLSTPDVESIDKLLRLHEPTNLKRADYLACGRRAEISVGRVEIDPERKVRRYLDEFLFDRSSGDGDRTLAQSLSLAPDGALILEETQQRLAKGLDEMIARANKQTRDTKRIFNIPAALGIVVTLNEEATLLDPDLAASKLSEMLGRRGDEDDMQNRVIILITEAHDVYANSRVTLYDTTIVYSGAGDAIPLAPEFAEDLKRRWVAFNSAGQTKSIENDVRRP
jgi:hypothetical protein